jgi:hypothetical protein
LIGLFLIGPVWFLVSFGDNISERHPKSTETDVYLIFRSTEILVPKPEYRIPTNTRFLFLSAPPLFHTPPPSSAEGSASSASPA